MTYRELEGINKHESPGAVKKRKRMTPMSAQKRQKWQTKTRERKSGQETKYTSQ